MDVEIAVLGGGVMGLATAWRAAVTGAEVLLLERFEEGHVRGSSHGATRIFRTAYPDPVYVRMAQRALPLWRELDPGVVRITGGIDVGPLEVVERIAAAQESCGERIERLSHGELAQRFPWLLVHAHAVFSPTYGVTGADRARAALAAAARAAGARLRFGSPASIASVSDEGVTLETAEGRVRARRCVVAAGAWARPLLVPHGVSLPVRVTREQVHYFSGEQLVPFIHWEDPPRYGVPAAFGAPGAKVAEYFGGTAADPDGRTFDLDEEAAARVRAYVDERLPGLGEMVGFETCLYTTTPDEGFVVDAHGPLVVVSPCSGHGFKFAPAIGEAAAALARGREPPFDLARFSLARF